MANSKTQTEIIVRNSGYVTLKKVVDDRDGVLCIAEGGRDVPFDIKRVYYVTHLENNHSVRGKHAHRALWQAIFCVNGSFMLGLDDGENRQEVLMWQAHVGFFWVPASGIPCTVSHPGVSFWWRHLTTTMRRTISAITKSFWIL